MFRSLRASITSTRSEADGCLNSCKESRRAYQKSRPHNKEYKRQRNQTEERKAFLYADLKC